MGQKPKKKPKKLPPQMAPTPLKKADHFPLLQSDLDALDTFCDGVKFEEISVETWESCLDDLAIQLPLWIDQEVASQGAAIPLKFSRRILNASESGILKEAVQIVLPVPAETKHGSTIVWAGYGDKQGSAQGDLVVTIHVRKPRLQK